LILALAKLIVVGGVISTSSSFCHLITLLNTTATLIDQNAGGMDINDCIMTDNNNMINNSGEAPLLPAPTCLPSKKRQRSWDVMLDDDDGDEKQETTMPPMERFMATYLRSRRIEQARSAIKIQFGPTQYLIDYGTKPLWTPFLRTLLDDSNMRDQQEAHNGGVVIIETSHIPLNSTSSSDVDPVEYDVAFSLLVFGVFHPADLHSMNQCVRVLELVEPFCLRLPVGEVTKWTCNIWAPRWRSSSFYDQVQQELKQLAQLACNHNNSSSGNCDGPYLIAFADADHEDRVNDDYPGISQMLTEFTSALDLFDIMSTACCGQQDCSSSSTTKTPPSNFILSKWRASDLWSCDFHALTEVESSIIDIIDSFLQDVSIFLRLNTTTTSIEFGHQVLIIVVSMVVQLFDPNRSWARHRPLTAIAWSTLVAKDGHHVPDVWLRKVFRFVNEWPMWSVPSLTLESIHEDSPITTTTAVSTHKHNIMLSCNKTVQIILDRLYQATPDQWSNSSTMASLSCTIVNDLLNQHVLSASLWRHIQKLTASAVICRLLEKEFSEYYWDNSTIHTPPLDSVTLVDINDIAHVFYRDDSTLSTTTLYYNGRSANVDDICKQINTDQLLIRRIILGIAPTQPRLTIFTSGAHDDRILFQTYSFWDMSDQFVAAAPEYNCSTCSIFTKETTMLWTRWADGVSQHKAPSVTLVFPEYTSIFAQSRSVQNYLRHNLNYFDHWMQATSLVPDRRQAIGHDWFDTMCTIDNPGFRSISNHFRGSFHDTFRLQHQEDNDDRATTTPAHNMFMN